MENSITTIRKQLARHIDTEGYVERFNETDRQIRKVSIDEYIESVRYPTKPEQEFINALVEQIEHEPTWLKLSGISWQFLIFTNGEGGLPHTHGPYIMLPYLSLYSIKPSTLVHEKIHVFQRYYPIETHLYFANSFPITGFAYPCDNMRANPDTSRILYGNMRPKWKENAKMITDITDIRDAPEELMAQMFES